MKILFRNLNRILKAIYTVAFLLPTIAFQGNEGMDEYAIKGMFVYNFAKYIDWTHASPSNNFRICVYGKSEITDNLFRIAANKKINNRTIEIVTINNLTDAANCQIIFISKSQNHILKEAIEKLGSQGILLVTEDTEMAQKGACMNIIQVDGKIKFELNQNAARRDGIKIANQLQSLAILVK